MRLKTIFFFRLFAKSFILDLKTTPFFPHPLDLSTCEKSQRSKRTCFATHGNHLNCTDSQQSCMQLPLGGLKLLGKNLVRLYSYKKAFEMKISAPYYFRNFPPKKCLLSCKVIVPYRKQSLNKTKSKPNKECF